MRKGVIQTDIVEVDDTATIISGADTARSSIAIRNTDAANSVYLGNASVTDTTGFELKAGEIFSTDSVTGAIYGICATGLTADLAVMEVK